MSEQRPSYHDVEACLGDTTAFISPSELHGLLLGTFCAKGTNVSDKVLLTQSLSDDNQMPPAQQQVLHAHVMILRVLILPSRYYYLKMIVLINKQVNLFVGVKVF